MLKSKELLVFRNWDEVNQALKELGDIDRRVTRLEADMNSKINDIKADFERDATPLINRKEQLEKNVQAFTECYQEEFVASKSKKFLYGTVGFRKTSNIVVRNVKAIIEAIKQNKMDDCLIITEKINKEELEKYDDKSLEKIGAKRNIKDKFFYELSIERVDG
ncbi:MAG: host-nuclease inhibitor Gam family protein [Bacillota bacterium]|nr:host-nuclease inhibitor Gam family protein [Bacillota bacterium]